MSLQVWTDGTDWYVAEDIDDIRACVIEQHGSWEEWEDREWTALPADKVISIHDSDGDLRRRGIATTTNPISGLEVVERTCAEWIASEGRGMLCSTEY